MVDRTEPGFTRGDRVRVALPNLEPWDGEVNCSKFSPVSGWWVDVIDADGFCHSVSAGSVSAAGSIPMPAGECPECGGANHAEDCPEMDTRPGRSGGGCGQP